MSRSSLRSPTMNKNEINFLKIYRLYKRSFNTKISLLLFQEYFRFVSNLRERVSQCLTI